jgi:hypothetical protein
MRRYFIALVLFACTLAAANVKLYLKDGNYHIVREYNVLSDRVRFYSVERSAWEEMPLELVDLKRTKGEAAQREATLAEEARILSEEDAVERQLQEEIARIPANPGVYFMAGKEAKSIKQAEAKVRNNRGRSILKAVSPIPVVAGKATLELDGEHSLNVFTNPTPEFYIQLAAEERFGIVKLIPRKGERIVEQITIIPVSKEIIEEPVDVEIFRKQLTPDGLYKIWPVEPLEPGEYAVVEYTAGKLNMQVWDFAYKPESK